MLDPLRLRELLLQAPEHHERGGVKVYDAAIRCAICEDLKHEWYQTRAHVQILEQILRSFEIDAEHETPGRDIVHGRSRSLVAAMDKAKAVGNPTADPRGAGAAAKRTQAPAEDRS